VTFSIRRLGRDDADAYRAIRLEALTSHPDAFASTAENFVRYSLQDLEALLEKVVFFGAIAADGSLAGIMAFDPGEGREAHRGWLLQVYVQGRLRGTGCAQALLDAIMTYAAGHVLQVHLGVASHNETAIRLYQKAGFEIYGTDHRFQFVNGRYVDEHLMVRFLDKAPGKKTDNE